MDRIRNLRDEDGRTDELVTSTSGGVFGTQYLAGEPPAAHLSEAEQPQYALRNKKAGVRITEDDDERTQRPDGDYQALAIVTDCRALFLIGHSSGDHVEAVAYDEIVEARTESSGFLKSVLTLETVDGDQYRFACRGDVSEVVAFVDGTAQTWANASRLVDEASNSVETGRELLAAGKFVDARNSLADVPQHVSVARERISSVGEGAAEMLESRLSDLLDSYQRLKREIAAAKGARHHAAAQEAWKTDHDFERAAAEYRQGATEYERALETAGTEPADETLQSRLKGLIKEQEVLRVAPTADAEAARTAALEAEDPDEAATEWETALACYREAVTLDWGERERGFLIERERARERASEATTNAIEARIEAGEKWVAAGDRIARNDRRPAAKQAYEQARDHFERAREIADELAPERTGDIEAHLDALEKRQHGGTVPSIDPDETTLSVAAVADHLDGPDQRKPAIRAVDTGEPADTGAAASQPSDQVSEADNATPAIRRHGDAPESEDTVEDPTASERTAPERTPEPVVNRTSYVEPTAGDEEPTQPATDATPATIREGLADRDEETLTELVATLWAEDGWSTTVFSAATETVYDILAMRERDGEDERLLLWTVHRPDGEPVGPTVVRQCATTRDSSQGADRATLVTTGTLTGGARTRAEELDVTVVDGEELAAKLLAAGLADRVV
ncbi:restriction endonuclease [Salinibaculum rarum]|uniref:restriction endonuclease n=1 Tax=Salinibaculum rarum TaxID=3058903 RepID=UPI00265FF218|nr:restriction endonuclease [Salinibaculum sp. KK48]